MSKKTNIQCVLCGCKLKQNEIAGRLDGKPYCSFCSEFLRFCNCAECGGELKTAPSGDSEVKGRIKGRPYCRRCIALKKIPAGRYGPCDDTSPMHDNVVRFLEGD